jgi:hypothetical protein
VEKCFAIVTRNSYFYICVCVCVQQIIIIVCTNFPSAYYLLFYVSLSLSFTHTLSLEVDSLPFFAGASIFYVSTSCMQFEYKTVKWNGIKKSFLCFHNVLCLRPVEFYCFVCLRKNFGGRQITVSRDFFLYSFQLLFFYAKFLMNVCIVFKYSLFTRSFFHIFILL